MKIGSHEFHSCWVIYRYPLDYPNHWVVRRWELRPRGPLSTPDVSLHTTLEAARRAIPQKTISVGPQAYDPPCAHEIWI